MSTTQSANMCEHMPFKEQVDLMRAMEGASRSRSPKKNKRWSLCALIFSYVGRYGGTDGKQDALAANIPYKYGRYSVNTIIDSTKVGRYGGKGRMVIRRNANTARKRGTYGNYSVHTVTNTAKLQGKKPSYLSEFLFKRRERHEAGLARMTRRPL
eukprot:9476406-Pyramimonas_sp.AAC.1